MVLLRETLDKSPDHGIVRGEHFSELQELDCEADELCDREEDLGLKLVSHGLRGPSLEETYHEFESRTVGRACQVNDAVVRRPHHVKEDAQEVVSRHVLVRALLSEVNQAYRLVGQFCLVLLQVGDLWCGLKTRQSPQELDPNLWRDRFS